MRWYVYIIECKDKKLYTGITSNLTRRIKDHNSSNGCRFTKYRRPVELLHSEEFQTKAEALKREIEIKGFIKISYKCSEGNFKFEFLSAH